MPSIRADRLLSLLRRNGPQPAAALAAVLGISQPTLSREIAALGEGIVRIGRARAARYAASREIARAGHAWPLYRIDANGHATTLGELRALAGDSVHFEASQPLPAFLHGDFGDGLFPGLPWFLDDQRPQGFLGRAFARRVAGDLGTPDDLLRWQPDDVILGLLRHGSDLPGDLVLGESALQRALQDALSPTGTIARDERVLRYPEHAERALRGEQIGSSAGGEQPKFLVTLHDGDGYRPVVVKFSDRSDSAGGRRWADLLRCEHIAADTLQAAGYPAARSEIVEADGRVFLESTRFDRTPTLGRHGFVSLAALDAAFHGHGRIDWWRYAAQLQRDGWLNVEDARRLRVLGWFGALIGNNDMHLGNAGLLLSDTRPLALAAAYDMLPMAFRPAASGEVVPRDYAVMLPTPEYRDEWRAAAAIAQTFWAAVIDEPALSLEFRDIARRAGEALAAAVARQR